ncbi:hypothetical protein BCR42DRAFT_339274 [Absidia repens]|uniref:Reverse transcriptase zinc-binding domain-containing protein n=1 Tax=Absidia repens TaxID=90262 RepID=A0A1X2HKA8_9FUNG|nr:hypothetical protein BCR42DRAFT_339274 [Absidia repens]
MTTKQWRLFWRTPISHGARNCWWRLLIQKLPTQEALRHVNPDSMNPGWCKICNKQVEDAQHMIIECPLKKSYWNAAKTIVKLDFNIADLWDILTFRKTIDKEAMIHVSDILLVLWIHHWHCYIKEELWNTTHAIRRFRKQLWNKGENFHGQEITTMYEEYLAKHTDQDQDPNLVE